MRVAVVIPIYKPRRADLDWYEKISLERCVEVLGHYPIRFVAPDDREFDYLPSTVDYKVEMFAPNYFEDIAGYNRLMTSPDFYARFFYYDYILIYQLDAFVFSDRLLEFCALGYDYIGAPWVMALDLLLTKPFISVGNGGFSLRDTRACFDVLISNAELVKSWDKNEDVIFARLGRMFPDQFKLAPVLTASRFSVEFVPERWCRKNGNVLPFGCHAWHSMSANFYVRVFSEFGIDLEPFWHLMKSNTLTGTEWSLRQVFTRRLVTRLNNGHPLRRYFPSDEEFFVILADSQSKPLASALYAEKLHVINQRNIPIINGDINRLQQASDVLKGMTQRGLLLSLTDDTNLVAQMASLGLQYNTQFVSFWQEAKKYSTGQLRRLSRPTVNR